VDLFSQKFPMSVPSSVRQVWVTDFDFVRQGIENRVFWVWCSDLSFIRTIVGGLCMYCVTPGLLWSANEVTICLGLHSELSVVVHTV
jgi:hypothetical protein